MGLPLHPGAPHPEAGHEARVALREPHGRGPRSGRAQPAQSTKTQPNPAPIVHLRLDGGDSSRRGPEPVAIRDVEARGVDRTTPSSTTASVAANRRGTSRASSPPTTRRSTITSSSRADYSTRRRDSSREPAARSRSTISGPRSRASTSLDASISGRTSRTQWRRCCRTSWDCWSLRPALGRPSWPAPSSPSGDLHARAGRPQDARRSVAPQITDLLGVKPGQLGGGRSKLTGIVDIATFRHSPAGPTSPSRSAATARSSSTSATTSRRPRSRPPSARSRPAGGSGSPPRLTGATASTT